MSLDALLAKLEARAVTPITVPIMPDVTAKPLQTLDCTDVTSVTAKNTITAQYYGDAKISSAQWNATDWQEYFNERVSVAEHCGGMTRDKAERMAYEACVSKWLNDNQPAITTDVCIYCGNRAGVIGRDAIITGSGHYLHHACLKPWRAQRRQDAIMGLADIDIIGYYGPTNEL